MGWSDILKFSGYDTAAQNDFDRIRVGTNAPYSRARNRGHPNALRFIVENEDDKAVETTYTEDSPLNGVFQENTWVHLVVTYSDTEAKLYVDGTEIQTTHLVRNQNISLPVKTRPWLVLGAGAGGGEATSTTTWGTGDPVGTIGPNDPVAGPDIEDKDFGWWYGTIAYLRVWTGVA